MKQSPPKNLCRWTDDEIRGRLVVHSCDKVAHEFHVSPKRIARSHRNEISSPIGHPKSFTEEHEIFILSQASPNPKITPKKLRKLSVDIFGISIGQTKVAEILTNNDQKQMILLAIIYKSTLAFVSGSVTSDS